MSELSDWKRHIYVPEVAEYERRIASSQAEIERLTEVLHRAQEALGEYACHIGEKHPCVRADSDCRNWCGKTAGDAALLIDAALSGGKP